MSSTRSRGALAVVLAALAGILILALPAAASARDRNHDHISDRWEKHYNLSLKVNQARRNQDRDNLNNRQEFRAGTDPRDADTNDDGNEDGDNGGTITPFDSPTRAPGINQFDRGPPTGQGTPPPQIKGGHGGRAPGGGGGGGRKRGPPHG